MDENRDYQWSIKLNNGEIYVIRADTPEALKLRRSSVMDMIDRNEIDDVPIEDELKDIPSPSRTPIQPVSELDPSMCTVHNIKMKERNGKNGKFYSHARELEENSWDYCSGKGFKSEFNK